MTPGSCSLAITLVRFTMIDLSIFSPKSIQSEPTNQPSKLLKRMFYRRKCTFTFGYLANHCVSTFKLDGRRVDFCMGNRTYISTVQERLGAEGKGDAGKVVDKWEA